MTTKTKMLCGLVALFAAGAVVGGSVGFAAAKRKSMSQPVAEQPRAKRDLATKWCSKLTDDLNLTPEQVAKIKPITERTSTELKALHTLHGDQVKGIFKASHEEIKALLTPEQLEIFEQKNREREMRFRKDKESASKPPKC
jgi:Spy/CpxP family protein refolding chaperone